MNVENLNKLIAHMEAMPDTAFDLSIWLRGDLYVSGGRIDLWPSEARKIIAKQKTTGGCGTVACLAGEAMLLRTAELKRKPKPKVGDNWWGSGTHATMDIMEGAQDWLGLTLRQAQALFIPWDNFDGDSQRRESVTRAQAVVVLKRFRDTGKVRWGRAGL